MAAICLGVFLYVWLPTLATAKFEALNSSSEPVELTVEWKDKTLELGRLDPGQRLYFEIDDEAAATFIAHWPSGIRISNEPIYFTSGTVVRADIRDSGIEVFYEY
ncbi:MAG: hypothetical protein ABJ308_16630 [Halieaceae bacterium]